MQARGHFELIKNTPIQLKCQRLPPKLKELFLVDLDKMLAAGTIAPAASGWSFPVIIATKKVGSPCFYVNFRA